MARVNHKLVRRLMDEKRSKISDQQFFTSRSLALHFEDIALAQTRRYSYDRRVYVRLIWNPLSSSAAWTDNRTIFINAGSNAVAKHINRAERYESVLGLFTHELGHCLFTDFLASQTHINYLTSLKWYPEPPKLSAPGDIRRESELLAFIRGEPKRMEALRLVAGFINNVIEDGYIENRMLAQFPGKLGRSLEFLRSECWTETPTVAELKEREAHGSHILESLITLMLSYVKYGELKYGGEPLSDERIQLIFSLLPDLDHAVTSTSAHERLAVTNLVLVRCADYIREFIVHHTDGAEGDVDAAISSALESIPGSSVAGAGSDTPVDDEPADPLPMMTGAERAGTKSDAGMTATDCGSPAETGETACEAPERMPYEMTERVSMPEGGSIERNDAFEPTPNEDAAKDIERLLDIMAEKAACEQLEDERLSELNEAAQGISYGNVHSGVSIRINRISSVDNGMIAQYKSVSPPLLAISRQLQKSLMQKLRDRRRGGKLTGLAMGRRLDAHALCRDDGKVFYRNSLPTETPELAVALLLDESGSMYGERSTYARAAGIILHDFCVSLSIPVMVYGHSTVGSAVMLYSYAEFDNIDGNDCYRLMDVNARNQNRDGAALRFVAEQLARRPEEIKLLILVSDGQPCDNGYYGSAAEEDLRGIKQEYRRKGVTLIAAAIGEDKQAIERIYGDSFLDITDLSQLPVKLTNLVKRHIRV